MRLLNRLHQYQRLWQFRREPQQVTVGELAERSLLQRTTTYPNLLPRNPAG